MSTQFQRYQVNNPKAPPHNHVLWGMLVKEPAYISSPLMPSFVATLAHMELMKHSGNFVSKSSHTTYFLSITLFFFKQGKRSDPIYSSFPFNPWSFSIFGSFRAYNTFFLFFNLGKFSFGTPSVPQSSACTQPPRWVE